MKKLPFLFLMAFSANQTANSQCANTSNIYSFNYGGKTYEVVRELKSWSNASACAVQRGGYLAEINDVNEQTAIYNGIIAAGVTSTYTSVSDGGGTAYVWIGATDKLTEGTWLWDGNDDGMGINFWNGQGQAGTGGGAPVASNYNNWGKDNGTGPIMEPDDFGTGQDAGAMALAGWPAPTTLLGVAGQWNDIDINNTLYYVIEKNSLTGMNDNKTNSEFQLFPNPSNDKISITGLAGKTEKNYSIYDYTGKLVLEGVMNEKSEINITTLNKGIYYFTLAGHNHFSCTFVKE
jgi:hypothetical protein